MKTSGLVFTIGYGQDEYQEFMLSLKAYGIKMVVDVRSYPNSRGSWANQKNLSSKLRNTYLWLPELAGPAGGHGKATKASEGPPRPSFTKLPRDQRPKTWWSPGLRAYDTWMNESNTFGEGIKKLQKLRDHWKYVAIMCSEPAWYKCHRSMISDAWTAMGGRVQHIINNVIDDHPSGDLLLDRLSRYEPKTQKLWLP